MDLNKISQFSHLEVRNLAWVLLSPSLLDEGTDLPLANNTGIWPDLYGWLSSLDQSPEPLHEYLQEADCRRLGAYFEALLLFALDSSPNTKILLKQHVFHGASRTLGECDVIFQEMSSGKVLHWELAVKFYLYHQGRYLGPNIRDRLDKKCRHLSEHQLRLPQLPEVSEELHREHHIQQLDSQVYMKGMLFYPLDFNEKTPKGIAKDHLCGQWCHFSALNHWCKLYCDSAARYQILSRREWLSRVSSVSEEGLLTFAELQQQLASHFTNHSRAKIVVMLSEGDEEWCEQRRCMVVDEGWPTSC